MDARAITERARGRVVAATVLLVVVACVPRGPAAPSVASETECPTACPPEAFARCGAPCPIEGESCANEIGDGMTCERGSWQCTVHAPLEGDALDLCSARRR
ncbi:MAG TPA: hypothetical protein VGB87_22165 [Vicinamibacteria bacterium]